jgi:hypothetical protein
VLSINTAAGTVENAGRDGVMGRPGVLRVAVIDSAIYNCKTCWRRGAGVRVLRRPVCCEARGDREGGGQLRRMSESRADPSGPLAIGLADYDAVSAVGAIVGEIWFLAAAGSAGWSGSYQCLMRL